MDFFKVGERTRKGTVEIYPKFIIRSPSADLMIRGGDFYAIYIPETGLWSTDEQSVIQTIDTALDLYLEQNRSRFEGCSVRVLHMWDAESGMIDIWHKYCQKQMRDSFHMLDEKLIFSNTEVQKRDYASKKLAYPLEFSQIEAYDRLMSVLYSPEERHKIEWSIGSVVSGDSKKLEKFLVLYGSPGGGKGTVLKIIKKLFDGYSATFDAKALGTSSNQFALESFRTNPLVAIQFDGDLSKIEDNTRLNSLVSHEPMTVNEKFKAAYSNSFKAFLFMGTNKPVKITDAKSGLIRRLIDVSPSGKKVPQKEYDILFKQIDFELGSIAKHCLDVYLADPHCYDGYIPTNMLGTTNDFYNFVEDSSLIFQDEDGVTLKSAWEMYKTYVDEANVPYPMSKMKFKEELKSYFKNYEDRVTIGDARLRNYYSGFRLDKFEIQKIDMATNQTEKDLITEMGLKEQESQLDLYCAECFAQYANEDENPKSKWANVRTMLRELDSHRLHYLKVPIYLIVIDFDIPDEFGNKSLEANLEAAMQWPRTYTELSKSGKGVHLHYLYFGDVSELEVRYAEHIEIKTFPGGAALRRKLTLCNDAPIATLNSGLPLKQKGASSKMVNMKAVKSEDKLCELIFRACQKEFNGGTKDSINFISKILSDAYDSGLNYDVTRCRQHVLEFAMKSTNHKEYCIQQVGLMKWKSELPSEPVVNEEAPIIFLDVEVFPNLFLVNYKEQGEGKSMMRLINPKPYQIEDILNKYRIITFNGRRYDNHMLYGCLVGLTNEGLYKLSQNIIVNGKGFFGEAYNISFTDVYDFAAKKQSLKKWEIELGFHHQELGLPWDKPVPEEMWNKVAEYCDNDVLATEAVFDHLQGDFVARKILAILADKTVNDTTNQLTTKIIFGNDRNPQSKFNYRNMGNRFKIDKEKTRAMILNYFGENEEFDKYTAFDAQGKPIFPGYLFENGKSTYRDEEVGEGGYVYAEPGIHILVGLDDVASMHPSSIEDEELFGEYTRNFSAIKQIRVHVKHKEFDAAGNLLNGLLISLYGNDKAALILRELQPYLTEQYADDLSYALKIAINSVYGLTSAKFENAFKDPRNIDNIVAKRGALFMINLKHEVQKRGFTVAHIKTDSIKIPGATKDILDFVYKYGQMYGYTFEHEATYEKMCLVNDAVYIAQYSTPEHCQKIYGYSPGDNIKHFKKHAHPWTATGTQFQVPYVFKTLFSGEEVKFEDMCEVKSVSKGNIYIDMNEGMADGEHNYQFVGRVGSFCPVISGVGGGALLRENEGKYSAVTGSKGYLWMESEMVRRLHNDSVINEDFYISMKDNAKKAVEEQLNKLTEPKTFEWFISTEPEDEFQMYLNVPKGIDDEVPWCA